VPGREATIHFIPSKGGVSSGTTLKLVHGDLCGPISPATSRGNKYFLLLVDDLSRYMWVAVIPSNDHAATAIKDIQAQAEGESGLKLKTLRTDRVGEFIVIEFTDYCAAEGMHHQHMAPYSPQQNNDVERRNGTVVATAKSMLNSKGLSRWFWGEVVNAVVYVLNRCPMKSVDGVAWKEAGDAPPQDVRVHHVCAEHNAAPEEAGGSWSQDDLHRLREWLQGVPCIRPHHEVCSCDT
jgi:transposase InsO family protein